MQQPEVTYSSAKLSQMVVNKALYAKLCFQFKNNNIVEYIVRASNGIFIP